LDGYNSKGKNIKQNRCLGGRCDQKMTSQEIKGRYINLTKPWVKECTIIGNENKQDSSITCKLLFFVKLLCFG
jgi:hypothetical protein